MKPLGLRRNRWRNERGFAVVFGQFWSRRQLPYETVRIVWRTSGFNLHRKGMLRFCKLAHKTAYIERKREQLKAEQRRKLWFDVLSRRPV